MITIKDIEIYHWGYEIRHKGQIALWVDCGKNLYKLKIEKNVQGKKYNTLAVSMINALLDLGHKPELPDTQRNVDFLCEYPHYIKLLR